MIAAHNIEIEDWDIQSGVFVARYFRDSHPCSVKTTIEMLECFVLKNKLLNWWNMVFRNNEYVDDAEGVWQFGDWIKEKLNDKIVRDFIVWLINEDG